MCLRMETEAAFLLAAWELCSVIRSLRRCVLALAVGAAMALPAAAATQLTGAGSTFDYPFFSKAFYIYSQKNADVTVNYQSIGSGGGIQQFTAKTVDFGATDVPMNAEEIGTREGSSAADPGDARGRGDRL